MSRLTTLGWKRVTRKTTVDETIITRLESVNIGQTTCYGKTGIGFSSSWNLSITYRTYVIHRGS